MGSSSFSALSLIDEICYLEGKCVWKGTKPSKLCIRFSNLLKVVTINKPSFNYENLFGVKSNFESIQSVLRDTEPELSY